MASQMKALSALAFALILGSCVTLPIKEVPYEYNYFAKTQAVKPGESIGLLVYEPQRQGFGLGGSTAYVQRSFVSPITMTAVRVFTEAGFQVKLVGMNFFTLTERYPAAGKILRDKFTATGKIDFDQLLDKAYERTSDFDYDVAVKKDLNRIRDDLGCKYLVLIVHEGEVPARYRTVVLDFTTYSYLFSQDALTKPMFGAGLLKSTMPAFMLDRMRCELRQLVTLITK